MQQVKKASFIRTLGEVLQSETEQVTRISDRTGKEYKAEVVKTFSGIFTGVWNETDNPDFIKYQVANYTKGLLLDIKAPKIDGVIMGKTLVFYNLTGGALPTGNGTWFNAEQVKIKAKL